MVTSTSADKVAVPPTSAKVKVVTPLIAPLAVISDPVTLFSVVKVKVLEPPVTAAIVMSALLLVVELVSMVTLLPSVTAPKLMASSELLIVEESVTVPSVLSVTPPLKVKVSAAALPKLRVPVLRKVTALVKVFELPVNDKLYPAKSVVSVVIDVLPENKIVPFVACKSTVSAVTA